MLASDQSPAFQAFGTVTGLQPEASSCPAQPSASPWSPGSARKSHCPASRIRPAGPSRYHSGPAACAGAAAAAASRSAASSVRVERLTRWTSVRRTGQPPSKLELLADDRRRNREQHGREQRVGPHSARKAWEDVGHRSPWNTRAVREERTACP